MGEYVKNHSQEVTAIKRAKIVKRNLLTVEEALKTIPGVEVGQSAGVASRISIRGSGKSGGVLVLLNGRPLNTNQYGGVDLNTIPIDMIESITVFKPPVPVWLGSRATDGAINIVTRDFTALETKEKEKPTMTTAGAGSFGLAQGSASRIVPVADGNMLLTAAGDHKDGKRPNSDRDDGNFSVSWDRDEEERKKSTRSTAGIIYPNTAPPVPRTTRRRMSENAMKKAPSTRRLAVSWVLRVPIPSAPM